MSELWGNFAWSRKSKGVETVGLVVIYEMRSLKGWKDGICQGERTGTDDCRGETEGLNI